MSIEEFKQSVNDLPEKERKSIQLFVGLFILLANLKK
jgi:hypothetical protein